MQKTGSNPCRQYAREGLWHLIRTVYKYADLFFRDDRIFHPKFERKYFYKKKQYLLSYFNFFYVRGLWVRSPRGQLSHGTQELYFPGPSPKVVELEGSGTKDPKSIRALSIQKVDKLIQTGKKRYSISLPFGLLKAQPILLK